MGMPFLAFTNCDDRADVVDPVGPVVGDTTAAMAPPRSSPPSVRAFLRMRTIPGFRRRTRGVGAVDGEAIAPAQDADPGNTGLGRHIIVFEDLFLPVRSGPCCATADAVSMTADGQYVVET